MKILAKTLCLVLLALPFGCDGGQREESAAQRQVAPSQETGAEMGDPGTMPGTMGDARMRGGVDRAEPDPAPSPELEEFGEPDASPAAPARGDKLPRDLWIWPDARAAEPDLDADLLDCSNRLAEDPELAARPELAQLGWILDCMAGRGWARNPDFAPSRD